MQTTAGAATFFAMSRRAYSYQQSPTNLRKFIIGVPGLGPSGKNEIGQYIPVAVPDKKTYPGSDYYTLVAGQYKELLHPDLPRATTLWGYADNNGDGNSQGTIFGYLGPVIVASSGRPVRLQMQNRLPKDHILPVDTTAFFPDAQAYVNKIAVHCHGGLVPWISDGGPYAWFTPAGGPVGPDYPLQPLDMPKKPGRFNYYYPNDQSARLMWYHDHAHDITRLNAYAGLASAYLITDAAEAGLVNSGAVPATQIPLIIQDKTFKTVADQWGKPGDLWYPSVYEAPIDPKIMPSMLYSDIATGGCTIGNETGVCGTARWDDYQQAPLSPPPTPSCIPEAFFDTILVNGAVFPYLSLKAKRYRLRILNGSNARFYNLCLYVSDSSGELDLRPSGDPTDVDPNGNPILIPNNAPGPAFIQIGNEAGFLPAPVIFSGGGNTNSNTLLRYNLNPKSPTAGNVIKRNLLLAPAERADVIIDLRGFENQTLTLYSDAPAPVPGGDIRNDYWTGAPDLSGIGGAPTPQPGKSPNTRTLMVIKVGTAESDSKTFSETVTALSNALPTVFQNTQPKPFSASQIATAPVRQLGLFEDFDEWGRLIQLIGPTTGGRAYDSAPTEMPHAGDTEVWQIFNTTGDTHPIHFHLVNVQIIARYPWSGFSPTGQHDFSQRTIGPRVLPDDNEKGWKETVRMNPMEVIKVIMKFDLPDVPTSVFDPSSQLSKRTNVEGHEYVYHCHILEHEEHDMMRPLIVVPKK